MTAKGQTQERWSPHDTATAAEIWQEIIADVFGEDAPPRAHRIPALQAIAKSLKRSFFSVEYRFNAYGPHFGAAQRRSNCASPHALAERDARREAEYRRCLTSQFFGDPPIGYSALDKRSGMRAR